MNSVSIIQENRSRRSCRVVLAMTTVLVGIITVCLSIVVSPAIAEEALFYTATPTATFGSSGSGEVVSPAGVAVNDGSGRVYVLENGGRVQVFDAGGNYQFQFIAGSIESGGERIARIVIDNSSGPSRGDVYILDPVQAVIDVFDENGTLINTIAAGESRGIAVDGSGNLWAYEENGNIVEFNSKDEGTIVFNTQNKGGTIAVDSGYVYGACCAGGAAVNAPGAEHLSKVFDWGNELGMGVSGIAADENNHHVFVVVRSGVHQFGEYGAGDGEGRTAGGLPYVLPIETFGEGEPGEPVINSAIAVNSKTGTVYTSLPEVEKEKAHIAIYKHQGFIVPTLGEPLPASGITRTTVTLTGAMNPMHSPSTYQFEYGTTTSYGAFTSPISAGKGGKEKIVDQPLKGLSPGTTYHYVLIATSPAGSITGPDQTFTTSPARPPTVTTGGASSVTLTTATLSGVIDPEGLQTSYVLELGTDTSYGTSISGEVGPNSEAVAIDIPVIELAPSTAYHYRFVAVNPDGRVYGADQAFTTPVYEHPIVLPNTEPLLGVPSIAFPTETANTAKPTSKKKAKHRTTHHRGKRHTAKHKRR
jgi:hypothetical protein